MYAFTFENPSSTAAAAQLIAQGGKLLAGGQSLLPSMRLRLANPEKIVDLNSIAELAGIRREGAKGIVLLFDEAQLFFPACSAAPSSHPSCLWWRCRYSHPEIGRVGGRTCDAYGRCAAFWLLFE